VLPHATPESSAVRAAIRALDKPRLRRPSLRPARGRCAEGSRIDDLGHPVDDVEVLPALDGSPENMTAWLIFSGRAAARSAARPGNWRSLQVRAHSLLKARGFPAHALGSFTLRYTSWPEIERGGGRFHFFR